MSEDDDFEWPDHPDIPDLYIDGEGHRHRVVAEVLGGVETFAKAVGPNGPWAYRSLTIRRTDNRIFVKDVDGRLTKMLVIPDGEVHDGDLHEKLKNKLDEIHEDSLDRL